MQRAALDFVKTRGRSAAMTDRPVKRARVDDEKICRIFYDCETSGQGCARFKQPRIIELAAVRELAAGSWDLSRCSAPKLTGYFCELIAGGPCSAYASAVHGLTDEDLQQSRSFEDVWSLFVKFAHDAQSDGGGGVFTKLCLAGHAAIPNDNYWLLSELQRCGRSIEELAIPGVELMFEDTFPLFPHQQRRLKAHLETINLQNSTIYRTLYPNAPAGEVHSALWDASATRDNWLASQIVRECSTKLTLSQQLHKWTKCVRRHQCALGI